MCLPLIDLWQLSIDDERSEVDRALELLTLFVERRAFRRSWRNLDLRLSWSLKFSSQLRPEVDCGHSNTTFCLRQAV